MALNLPATKIHQGLRQGTVRSYNIVPVLCGSAFKTKVFNCCLMAMITAGTK